MLRIRELGATDRLGYVLGLFTIACSVIARF